MKSKENITIVNYGLGNLYNLSRALIHCGCENVKISSNPDDILIADKIILPGVGAFRTAMIELKERKLVKPICEFASSGKPLLGICLGMQILATNGEEFGLNDGLGLIPGRVIKIADKNINYKKIKIPFIGWSNIIFEKNVSESNLYSVMDKNDELYFVHSYEFIPTDQNNIIAKYDYCELKINAIVQLNNIIGFQFHPEKSGPVGLKLLKKFTDLK